MVIAYLLIFKLIEQLNCLRFSYQPKSESYLSGIPGQKKENGSFPPSSLTKSQKIKNQSIHFLKVVALSPEAAYCPAEVAGFWAFP